MPGIARKSGASNETLCNWCGDKRGLFAALVTRNAAEARILLETELSAGGDAIATLGLPELLPGNRAIALNRAAADPSGELGAAISDAGGDAVLPLLEQGLDGAEKDGRLTFDQPQDAAGLLLNLLAGDLQIRRGISRLPAPAGPRGFACFCHEGWARAHGGQLKGALADICEGAFDHRQGHLARRRM